MFGADPSDFFADFGVPVVWLPPAAPAVNGVAIVDQPDIELDGGRAKSRERKLTAAAATFAGIDNGHPLRLGSDEYLVRSVTRIDDGDLIEILVGRKP